MDLIVNLSNRMFYYATKHVGMMFLNSKGVWRPSRITIYEWDSTGAVEIKEWV